MVFYNLPLTRGSDYHLLNCWIIPSSWDKDKQRCQLSWYKQLPLDYRDNVMSVSGYPETVVVSSQGPAAEMFPLAMGVYTKMSNTFGGRPVWRGRNGTLVFNSQFVI